MYIKGSRIRQRRLELGLSQEELASRINGLQKQISKYERGQAEPSSDTVYLLARELGVSTDWLYGITDHMRPEIEGTEVEALALLMSQSPEQRKRIVSAIKALLVQT